MKSHITSAAFDERRLLLVRHGSPNKSRTRGCRKGRREGLASRRRRRSATRRRTARKSGRSLPSLAGEANTACEPKPAQVAVVHEHWARFALSVLLFRSAAESFAGSCPFLSLSETFAEPPRKSCLLASRFANSLPCLRRCCCVAVHDKPRTQSAWPAFTSLLSVV